MDFRQLRYFVAIADAGTISGAAQRLGVAQPSLSQHMIRLEEEVGAPLLVRTSRGVVLTESGGVLVKHARNILRYVELAREEVRHLGAEPRGRVAFGLPSSISMVLSVPLVEAARARLPTVSLRIVEAMSGHILHWLDQGEIDLAILYNADHLRHHTVTRVLTEDLYLISVPDRVNQPLDKQGRAAVPIPLAEVGAQPLVLPSREHGLRILIDQQARLSGIDLSVVAEVDALAQIRALVARGEMVSILSLSAVHQDLVEGRLAAVPIVAPTIQRSVDLVRNPAHTLSRASIEVEKLAVDIIRELTSQGAWRAHWQFDSAQTL
mgnify:CR=1 FL=1